MFSCEFCEICKNPFFTEHVWATASLMKKKWSVSITLFKIDNSKYLSKVPHEKLISKTALPHSFEYLRLSNINYFQQQLTKSNKDTKS